MGTSPLLSIREATISFAQKTLFENISINLFAKDRICLIGRNGVGKTTLMNAIIGNMEFDKGVRWIAPGCTIGYLSQAEDIEIGVSALDYIMKAIKEDDAENHEEKTYLADIICHNLQIDKNALMQDMSGGQARRTRLAKALVLEPDILLLDEPTNHLDLEVIEWLENYLNSYQGTVLAISHDRKFLANISNKVFWLRNKMIKTNNHGYSKFEEWADSILDQEEREMTNLARKIHSESGWVQTGVTARRKRNMGRLRKLQELRQKLKSQKSLINEDKNQVKINSQGKDENSSRLVINLNNVCKSFGDKTIMNKFSLKMLKGEKIGILGKNGSGKSTFLKMIMGEILPDQGKVKVGKNIEIAYFDQNRSDIKKDLTVQRVLCSSGSDYIKLANGKTRHVMGYLKDFLFDPKEAKTLASTLSGGQQNRLLLAKTLANPGNFLILDEPTNDLDMDSLDMLQDFLSEYKGNLLIVSHDRDFLDNVATSILAFEGDGQITNNLGGYSDYLEYKKSQEQPKKEEKQTKPKEKQQPQKPITKFSYKHKYELEKLPDKMAKLEEKITLLSEELSQTEERGSANLAQISMEIGQLQFKLNECEERWLELEEMKENS